MELVTPLIESAEQPVDQIEITDEARLEERLAYLRFLRSEDDMI